MEEFDAVLAAIETERPAGLVIRSAKPSGFIAGADVNEFRGASDPEMVETRDRPRACGGRSSGSTTSCRRSPSSTASASAAASRSRSPASMRIAIDGARFGFPEVMLGLHPGLGGTARFTALVNPTQSMALMLTGRTIDARRAKSLGLVDTVTQERHVNNAVKDALFGRLKRAQPGRADPRSQLRAGARACWPNACAAKAAKAAPASTIRRPTR